MKILFISDLYPVKKNEKNTPTVLHDFVWQWAKKYDITVIKPNFVFNSFLRKKPFYKTALSYFDNIKIYNINYFFPFWFNVFCKITGLNKQVETSDLILAHMPSGIIFADKINEKYKKKFVCAVHNSDIEVLTNPIYKFYFRNKMIKAYKNSYKIACRSNVLKEKFDELFPEFSSKTFVASSGIDEKFILNNIKPMEKIRTVLTCANLIKRKNIDKIISVAEKFPDIEFKIIVDGLEFEALKKLAENCKNVEFLGYLPNSEVLEEMRKADVFILPSVKETFGKVYLEAMASGCITICTEKDGIEGIIVDGKNGFVVKPNKKNIENVLRKICELKNIQ